MAGDHSKDIDTTRSDPKLFNNHHGVSTTIPYAEWPRDAPSALERNVLTIVCGNTRLHWALHEGCVNKFIPIMFWYTIHDESKDDNDEDPCDVLEAHIANQAHALIFGPSVPKGSAQKVSAAAAKRQAPGISVFVVSSNPNMERKIRYMFRDVPAKLYKLRNTDFFSLREGVYPTLGVDRVAALYGAKTHYGAPALVIDGGTALTYTMLDADGKIAGGGISPGVKVRLQSLADYTGSLPTIDHATFKETVENAMNNKKLPFFARDTETAMIAPVCSELAGHLRNIIKQYVAKCTNQTEESLASATLSVVGEETAEQPSHKRTHGQQQQQRFPVIVTGGDGKFFMDLLQHDASNIVNVEPKVSPIPPHAIELRHVKNLVTYALGDVLYAKFSQQAWNDPLELLRLKIQGLRIAAPLIDQKEIFSRGCVYNTSPNSNDSKDTPYRNPIDGYVFHARFDNGTKKDLGLRELYDALALYNEIGESWDSNSQNFLGVDENWIAEKKEWSEKVQEELGNLSRMVRSRIHQLKPYKDRGELGELFKKRSAMEARDKLETHFANKKAKMSSNDGSSYVGKRIAKRFPIDIDGKACDQVFFGTVQNINDSSFYFVTYDDGDQEELEAYEIENGIELYDLHKLHDKQQFGKEGTSPSNQDKPKSSLPQGILSMGAVLHPRSSSSTNDSLEDAAPEYADLATLLEANGKDPLRYKRQISECKEEI